MIRSKLVLLLSASLSTILWASAPAQQTPPVPNQGQTTTCTNTLHNCNTTLTAAPAGNECANCSSPNRCVKITWKVVCAGPPPCQAEISLFVCSNKNDTVDVSCNGNAFKATPNVDWGDVQANGSCNAITYE